MADLTFSATILNVNDDDATRYLSTRTLRLAGYRVLEAATGQEALRIAAQERPDVVVLDVKLPDISGYEVCQRLRAQPHTASIAVMHTSATFVTPDKKVRGLEGGADAYLTEPFEGEELVATVRSLLRIKSLYDQVELQKAELAKWNLTLEARVAHGVRRVRGDVAAPAEPQAAGGVEHVPERHGKPAGRRLARVGDPVGDDDQAAQAVRPFR